MDKIKIYSIICRYKTETGYIKININDRLEELDIEPDINYWCTNYRFDKIVYHDVGNFIIGDYLIEARWVDKHYMDEYTFGISMRKDDLLYIVNKMYYYRENYLSVMHETQINEYYKKYYGGYNGS